MFNLGSAGAGDQNSTGDHHSDQNSTGDHHSEQNSSGVHQFIDRTKTPNSTKSKSKTLNPISLIQNHQIALSRVSFLMNFSVMVGLVYHALERRDHFFYNSFMVLVNGGVMYILAGIYSEDFSIWMGLITVAFFIILTLSQSSTFRERFHEILASIERNRDAFMESVVGYFFKSVVGYFFKKKDQVHRNV
jgi:hypothetical protein